METIINQTATQILKYLDENLDSEQQLLFIGIAGIPGSGKTTLSKEICKNINQQYNQLKDENARQDICTCISMDGFHYYKKELKQMKNPEKAFQRRGAPFTFNSRLFYEKLFHLKNVESISFPSFNHKNGDPIENDIPINKSQHKCVIIEGNYILLNDDDDVWWRRIRDEILDLKYFLKCDFQMAMNRVLHRHMETGNDFITAKQRIENNDSINAKIIMATEQYADHVIESIEDDHLI